MKQKPHEGKIDRKLIKAVCSCGFAGKERNYMYEASEDLIKHFEDAGMMYALKYMKACFTLNKPIQDVI